MTKSELKVHEDIKKYGYHITHVENFHNESEKPFSYSIGFFKTFQKPEILIIGLKMELREILIHNIFDDYKNGKELKSGKFNSGILDNFKCLVIDVEKEKYDGFVNWAMWYYNSDFFPVQQIIYPTINGVFPWEKDFPNQLLYPVLSKNINIEG